MITDLRFEGTKRRIRFSFLLLIAAMFFGAAKAQVVSTYYTFSQSSGTYTPGTAGFIDTSGVASATPANIFVLGWDDKTAIFRLPFNFTFNGTLYNAGTGRIGLDSDGWFTFSNGNPTMTGQTGGGSWTNSSIHTGNYLFGTANGNGFAGFNSDLNNQALASVTATATIGSNVLTAVSSTANIQIGARLDAASGITNGTIVTGFTATTITMSANATASATITVTPNSSIIGFVTGTFPNRQFIIQWTGAKRFFETGTENINFQMILNEGAALANLQTLQVMYGTCSTSIPGDLDNQVGLRGTTAADFNARTSTTSWGATTAAGANTNIVRFNGSTTPASGLTFTWSPCTMPPAAAGAITGATTTCPNTTQNYSLTAVAGAVTYAWAYSGTNTTFTAVTNTPNNTFNFSPTATSGTISVTPTNICGTGAAGTLAVTVTTVTPVTISYPAAGYCTSTVGTIPVTGPVGTTYTSSPAGLTMTTGGTITPSTSAINTYTVSYTYTSGGCPLTATTTVSIGDGVNVSALATPNQICTGNNSQLNAYGGTTANYTVVSIPYNKVNQIGSPTTVTFPIENDDDNSNAITIPFTFKFYGSSFTQLYVSTNGFIELGASTSAYTSINQTFPDATTPNNVIALCWSDLVVDVGAASTAKVRYFTNGTTPNRVMVIEYQDLSFYDFFFGDLGNVSGQIRLYEADNHIEVALGMVSDLGLFTDKTLGIENSTGTLAITPVGRNNGIWNTATEAWAFYPSGGTTTYAWSPATYLSSTVIANPVAIAVAANITYTVTATNAGCNTSTTVTVNTGAALNGTYTVGSAGTFTTLTAAIDAYNKRCITGPVTFSLLDATYSANESFPIIINSNAYASSTNTLTIKPAVGINPTITGSDAAAIIKLNGADYVTIDGSNAVGGTTQNLTLTNTSVSKYSSNIIWMNSLTGNGATNNTFKNINFTGGGTTNTFTALLASGSALGAVAEAANSNTTIQNNVFTKAETAIALVGPSGNETNNIINNNIVGSSVVASKLGTSGIELYQQASCQVTNNTIAGITSAVAGITTIGLYVSGTANGISINANKISDIKQSNSGGYGANGMWLSASTTSSNINVFNNFIFDITGYGSTAGRTPDYNGYGISIDYGGGYNIYYNTINLNTPQTVNGLPAALNVTSGVITPSCINLKNNIFQNNQTAARHYAIQSGATKTVYGLMDYNAYFSAAGGTTALGYLGGNLTALSDIQNVTTGFGQNAFSIQPATAAIQRSATNPHMDTTVATGNNNILNWKNKGNPIAGYTVDYDTTTRNGLNPDVGADEWVEDHYGSWVGKTNTDWLVPTNWEANVVPYKGTDVFVTGGYTNMPTILTTQAVRNITISNSSPLVTIGTGGTLQVYGTITRSAGNFDGTNGTLEMDSTIGAQPIPANLFVGNNLKNLIINNSNASGVTIGGTLDIYRSVTFGGSGIRLNTGGFLTFKSTASETAWLGNTAGKVISGLATVERYLPTGTGGFPNHGKSWQLLAAPVFYTSGGQTVNQAWQDTATSANQNRYNGYGTQITSDIAGAVALGFDVYTPTGGPSMKTYDPLTNKWVGIANTNTLAIQNKKGYLVFVRGNRSVVAYNQSAVPTTLRAKGNIYSGSGANIAPTTTILAGKYETLGNPYPSAIDFLGITKPAAPAVDDAFYIWDPLIPGTYGYGAYQTISAGNGYKPNPGGTANYSSATAYTTIQSGQAFFMHATGAGGTITFNESMKPAGGGSQVLFRNPPLLANSLADRKFLRTHLFVIINDEPLLADGNVLAIDDEFTNEYTSDDASKLDNGGENFGISSCGKTLALEAHAPLQENDTIFYSIKNLRKTTYRLKFGPENMQGLLLTPYFIDKFTNTNTILSLSDTTTVDFTITDDIASSAEDRFIIVFKLVQVVPVKIVHIAATRNSDRSITVDWKVENEIDIDHYELERSGDGRSFNQLQNKTPLVNNGGAATYVHADMQPLVQDNFYRVKAIGRNGQVQYSAIVKVAPLKGQPSVSIYPNPVIDNKIQVQFTDMPEGEYAVQLSNSIGQVIYKGKWNVISGNQVQVIELKTLAAGNYQLTAIGANGQKKVVQVRVE